MASSDAPNHVSTSQTQQLTAPPGWTKKLVPAKAKYNTLRKHDVVFIAPDGQEMPSQWHLRRYLKAHPEGPAPSEFNWSSGEESIRRSTRASMKAISYSEKKSRSKRNARELDAEGADEDKVKTPARKRAKKAGKEDSSVVNDEVVLSGRDEVMHEVPEGATAESKADDIDIASGSAVREDEVDTDMGKVMDNTMEEEAAAENAVNATDGAFHEELKVEEITEHFVGVKQQVEVKEHVVEMKEHVEVKEQVEEVFVGVKEQVEVKEHVVEVKEHVEVKEQVEEVEEQMKDVVTILEPQDEAEPKGVSGLSPLVAPFNEIKGEEPILESEKPLEPFDACKVESKTPLDQNLEVREDVHKVPMDSHVVEEHHDASLEPLMQKEEQERLPTVENSPLKVEHIKEKSPNELSNSPVPVSVGN